MKKNFVLSYRQYSACQLVFRHTWCFCPRYAFGSVSNADRLGFKTCWSKTKTKTKTKTQQFQDQDQDRDSRLTRPILEVYDWNGLWQTKQDAQLSQRDRAAGRVH